MHCIMHVTEGQMVYISFPIKESTDKRILCMMSKGVQNNTNQRMLVRLAHTGQRVSCAQSCIFQLWT